MLVISRAPSSAVYRAAPFFFGAVMLLLALVPLIGAEAGGAKRWIAIGGFTFQPSELAKCALILIVSYILSVGASAVTGTILYYTLILLASPRVCGQIWVLSLFLMACLMITSHQQLKKMK